jgi:hypothetical protein
MVYGTSKLVRFCLGSHLDYPKDKGQSAVREIITLFSIILTAAIALIWSQLQSSHYLIEATIMFVCVSAICIVPMFLFMITALPRQPADQQANTNPNRKEPRDHFFDWGTIVMARYFFVATIFSVSGLVVMTLTGMLPGQVFDKETMAKIEDVKELKLKSKEKGIVFTVRLAKDHYPKGIPRKLNMAIRIEESFAATWRVEEVIGFTGSGTQLKELPPEEQPALVVQNPEVTGKYESMWLLDDLKETGLYSYHVKLKSVKDVRDANDAIKEINQGRVVRVIYLAK